MKVGRFAEVNGDWGAGKRQSCHGKPKVNVQELSAKKRLRFPLEQMLHLFPLLFLLHQSLFEASYATDEFVVIAYSGMSCLAL